MTKKNIDKNFEYSTVFTQYSIEHPSIMNNVPKGAEIILIPENEKELASMNEDLGKQIIRTEKKLVIKAIQKGKAWRLERMRV